MVRKMADRMDEILHSVADEADRSVDYAALHDAILAAHTKKKKSFLYSKRMLSYAAAFVAVVGVGAFALTSGWFSASSPKSAGSEDGLGYDSYAMTPAAGALPEAASVAPDIRSADESTSDEANGGASETPEMLFGTQNITGSSQSDVAFDAPTLAAEVLSDKDAVLMDVKVLNEADKSKAGQSPYGDIACSTSYNLVYIEPLAGAPELGKALVSDLGGGNLSIYWSASETLHVYGEFLGYTKEDAIALLTEIG
jgi:hypothetical protein